MADEFKHHNVVIWPSRLQTTRPLTVKPPKKYPKGDITDVGFNLASNTAIIPLSDNAYDRTVRLHESLHALYSEAPGLGSYGALNQALEDSRLHLVHAKTQGSVRRDEVFSAINDLRNLPQRNSDLAILIAMRSLAILRGGDKSGVSAATEAKLEQQAKEDMLFAQPNNIITDIHKALDYIERGDMKTARTIMEPYFIYPDSEPQGSEWPQAGKGGEGDDDADGYGHGQPLSFEEADIEEGGITNDAVDLLSQDLLGQLNRLSKHGRPHMKIKQLYANESVRTFFGATERTAMSGKKIRSKKLALAVGPNLPRLFLRTINRKGGTVLIDASGSMRFSNKALKAICDALPMATVAYYCGATRLLSWGGNGELCVYSRNGLRTTMSDLPRCGSDNAVDFPAMQWLLKQNKPRWFLTDIGFTGNSVVRTASHEFFNNAVGRKLFTHVTDITQIQGVELK